MSSPNFRLSGGSLGYWTPCNNFERNCTLPYCGSSSSGGGRPGNTTMVVSSQSEQKMLKSIFAGAVFESGSAPVFNFNGNFNLFWVNSLRNVSM